MRLGDNCKLEYRGRVKVHVSALKESLCLPDGVDIRFCQWEPVQEYLDVLLE